MKNTKPIVSFAPHEVKRFVLPLAIAVIALLGSVVADSLTAPPRPDVLTAAVAALGIVHVLFMYYLTGLSAFRYTSYKLLNALLNGIGVGIFSTLLPADETEIIHLLIVFSTIVMAVISERWFGYVTLLMIGSINLLARLGSLFTVQGLREVLPPYFIAVVALEVIARIKDTSQMHIRHLEIVNNVSREIMQTLDRKRMLALLNTAIQDTLQADSYFIGFVDNDHLRLELCYDDGEYFNDMHIPLEGTLSNWVIKNRKELFLPDLREEVELEGVQLKLVGKKKNSLSWIGIPLNAEKMTGILVLASYTANAFDQADLELLTSLGQHVTLALDNALRHAQVEEQVRLDSLTGVYNHGYFLELLEQQTQRAAQYHLPLSVIMLDIDYFKRYNDTYGHLAGDRILTSICKAIRNSIKQTDAVGRWGGEEFVISLPGANGHQAYQIALRIAEATQQARIEDYDHRTLPIPTISQGIAVYPSDADEIYRLIDIADQRLYVAKGRGRNQIEPAAHFWRE